VCTCVRARGSERTCVHTHTYKRCSAILWRLQMYYNGSKFCRYTSYIPSRTEHNTHMHLKLHSNHATICLICGFTAICWTLTAFSGSWSFTQSQGLYLNTEQHKHRIKAKRHPCLEWDWTHDLSVRAGDDGLCLRPRGRCDRHAMHLPIKESKNVDIWHVILQNINSPVHKNKCHTKVTSATTSSCQSQPAVERFPNRLKGAKSFF
jgi:hypothetical protein